MEPHAKTRAVAIESKRATLVVQRGNQMLFEKLEQRSTNEVQDGDTPVNGGKQLALGELIKPSN